MHVAIILGGNARWAQERGRSLPASHLAGAAAVRAVVDCAATAQVKTLTLYAVSAPLCTHASDEMAALRAVFRRYLLDDTDRCVERQIRIDVVGRRDGMDGSLLRAIDHSQRLCVAGPRMHLRIVFDYGAQDEIMHTVWGADRHGAPSADAFFRLLAQADPSALGAGAVDLFIRTGRRTELSSYMLWELAYAELCFTDCLWPDFGRTELLKALQDYSRRQNWLS